MQECYNFCRNNVIEPSHPIIGMKSWRRQLCQLAASSDLIVALENHADLKKAELERVLADVSHPALRLTIDVGNIGILFEEPLQALVSLLPHAASIHMKNYRAIWYPDGFRLTCSRPRLGIIDFDALIDVLRQAPAEQEIALLIEAHVEADLDELEICREYLAEVRRSSLSLSMPGC